MMMPSKCDSMIVRNAKGMFEIDNTIIREIENKSNNDIIRLNIMFTLKLSQFIVSYNI